MKESELRIGLLISGGGTTAEAVIKACQEGRLKRVKPVAVISSRPKAPGVQKAQRLGIETFVVQPKKFPTIEAFGKKLLEILKTVGVDLVSQNGWLVKTPLNVVGEYERRIINQHPGPLDPGKEDFGGKGMYGARVTCARLAYEWAIEEENAWTESTIHHVTEEYDQGDLIRVVQMEVPSVTHPVTIAELQEDPQLLVKMTKKVQKELLPLEHKNVIATLRGFAEGKQLRCDRLQSLIPPKNERILYRAKNLAVELFPGE